MSGCRASQVHVGIFHSVFFAAVFDWCMMCMTCMLVLVSADYELVLGVPQVPRGEGERLSKHDSQGAAYQLRFTSGGALFTMKMKLRKYKVEGAGPVKSCIPVGRCIRLEKKAFGNSAWRFHFCAKAELSMASEHGAHTEAELTRRKEEEGEEVEFGAHESRRRGFARRLVSIGCITYFDGVVFVPLHVAVLFDHERNSKEPTGLLRLGRVWGKASSEEECCPQRQWFVMEEPVDVSSCARWLCRLGSVVGYTNHTRSSLSGRKTLSSVARVDRPPET